MGADKILRGLNSGSPVLQRPQKKRFRRIYDQIDNRNHLLTLNFPSRIHRNSALSNYSIDPLFGTADMGSLLHSREWQSDRRFRDLPPSRSHRRNLKMWAQALEFVLHCAVAKYTFFRCRRSRKSSYVLVSVSFS